MSNPNTCPRADIGGQAVLEGVMMKAPRAMAISVRRDNGDVVVKREEYTPLSEKHKWMGLPFIRGSVNMIYMLYQGQKVLTDLSLSDEVNETADGCALRIYYAQPGEDVWEIAKQCRTSMDAVMEENGLDSEILPQKTMLLIPMVES